MVAGREDVLPGVDGMAACAVSEGEKACGRRDIECDADLADVVDGAVDQLLVDPDLFSRDCVDRPQPRVVAHQQHLPAVGVDGVHALSVGVSTGDGEVADIEAVETVHSHVGPNPDEPQRVLVYLVGTEIRQTIADRQSAKHGSHDLGLHQHRQQEKEQYYKRSSDHGRSKGV